MLAWSAPSNSRPRVSHLCPKSWEAYGNLPKSTECVMPARLQLYDKQKDWSALSGVRLLEGVVGKPVGVQSPPSAPSQYSKGIWLRAKFPFFVKTARVAEKWLALKSPWGPTCDVGPYLTSFD